MKMLKKSVIAVIATMFVAYTMQAQTFQVRYNTDDFAVVNKNDSVVYTISADVRSYTGHTILVRATGKKTDIQCSAKYIVR